MIAGSINLLGTTLQNGTAVVVTAVGVTITLAANATSGKLDVKVTNSNGAIGYGGIIIEFSLVNQSTGLTQYAQY